MSQAVAGWGLASLIRRVIPRPEPDTAAAAVRSLPRQILVLAGLVLLAVFLAVGPTPAPVGQPAAAALSPVAADRIADEATGLAGTRLDAEDRDEPAGRPDRFDVQPVVPQPRFATAFRPVANVLAPAAAPAPPERPPRRL